MKRLFRLFLLAGIISLSISCRKEYEEPKDKVVPKKLPAISTEGKETFGCVINGEVWLPKTENRLSWEGGGYPDIKCIYGYPQSEYPRHMQLQANLKLYDIGFISGLHFWLPPLNGQTKVALTDKNSLYTDSTWCCDPRYKTYQGEMNILRLDTVAKVFSGTFWFDAAVNGDTVRIRGGRFDVKFHINDF